jgi:hypothetical protein
LKEETAKSNLALVKPHTHTHTHTHAHTHTHTYTHTHIDVYYVAKLGACCVCVWQPALLGSYDDNEKRESHANCTSSSSKAQV